MPKKVARSLALLTLVLLSFFVPFNDFEKKLEAVVEAFMVVTIWSPSKSLTFKLRGAARLYAQRPA